MKNNLLLVLFTVIAFAGESQPIVTFTSVTLTGSPALDNITDIVRAGDASSNIYIVQKEGIVRTVTLTSAVMGTIASQQFLSITNLADDSNSETGLLGMAIHPDWPDSNYIYVNYVIEGTITTRISRFTVPGPSYNNADEASIKVLFDVPGIQSNHKAGDLMFGPDGYLYITTGDGGGGGDPGNNGQDYTEKLGKIHRINVNASSPPNNYSIPPDNPFPVYTGAGDTLPEIWMIGARNPWRFSFDASTGDLWIADVGQGAWEEFNMIPFDVAAGANLGWDCVEGTHDFPSGQGSSCNWNASMTDPIYDYSHGTGWCVTGGYVYRGNEPTNSSLKGYYLGIDYGSDTLFLIKQTGTNTFNIYKQGFSGNPAISTFGEDNNLELYAGNLNGVLYSISADPPLAIMWENLIATPLPNGNKISWTLYDLSGVDYFEVQRSLFSDFHEYTGLVELPPVSGQIQYTYHDPYLQREGVYYRIAAYMEDGTVEYSSLARILSATTYRPTLTFDFNTGKWRISLPDDWQKGDMTLYDVEGRVVDNRKLPEMPQMDLSGPATPGVYFITIHSEAGTWSGKIVR